MSSIYKKGRDGYYYYQTYLYNPKSGKKNKKIFHSLGTKNFSVAQIKQKKYDAIYNDDNSKRSKGPKFFLGLIKNRNFRIFVFVILVSGVSKRFILNESSSSLENYGLIEEKSAKQMTIYSSSGDNSAKIFQKDVADDLNDGNYLNESSRENKITNQEYNNSDVKPTLEATLPKFKIERLERLPDAFSQGKFFITVSQTSSIESIRLLCDNITKTYTEFSNFVICIYSDSKFGRDLASGKNIDLDNELLHESWLGFYTYNPVEGAFFDNNPSGYSGAF